MPCSEHLSMKSLFFFAFYLHSSNKIHTFADKWKMQNAKWKMQNAKFRIVRGTL